MGNSSTRTYRVKAWRTIDNSTVDEYLTAADFPETAELPELKKRPSTAIGFSGGGTRAMVITHGFLAGLRDLGLLDNIRYIAGISGGSWGITTYLYGQLGDKGDDIVFLGEVVNPEDTTMDKLNAIDPRCLRKLATNSFFKGYLETIFITRSTAWLNGVSSAILEPAGIRRGQLYSWNEKMVEEIVERNKHAGLKKEAFILPRKKENPYFVIGWAVMGPQQGLFDKPYTKGNRNFHAIEATPLYVGTIKNYDTRYNVHGGVEVHYGGLIEPFAFAVKGGKAPKAGLPAGVKAGEIDVPIPKAGLDLSDVTCTSSLAASAVYENLYVLDELFDTIFDYWSPASDSPTVTPLTFVDGGCVQNVPLIPFIQREVEKIILVVNSFEKFDYHAIQSVNWRATKKIPDVLEWSTAAFFGISGEGSENYNEYSKLQVFETEEFQDLIDGFQAAYELGKGMFYRKKFTTVDNQEYGIRAGRKVDVTFYLNGICNAWKEALPKDVAAKVIDVKPRPISHTCGPLSSFFEQVKPEEYENFPHNYVTEFQYTNGEANLLANMTGWAVKQHADLMRDVLS